MPPPFHVTVHIFIQAPGPYWIYAENDEKEETGREQSP